jgi:hypothetical protein
MCLRARLSHRRFVCSFVCCEHFLCSSHGWLRNQHRPARLASTHRSSQIKALLGMSVPVYPDEEAGLIRTYAVRACVRCPVLWSVLLTSSLLARSSPIRHAHAHHHHLHTQTQAHTCSLPVSLIHPLQYAVAHLGDAQPAAVITSLLSEPPHRACVPTTSPSAGEACLLVPVRSYSQRLWYSFSAASCRSAAACGVLQVRMDLLLVHTSHCS